MWFLRVVSSYFSCGFFVLFVWFLRTFRVVSSYFSCGILRILRTLRVVSSCGFFARFRSEIQNNFKTGLVGLITLYQDNTMLY